MKVKLKDVMNKTLFHLFLSTYFLKHLEKQSNHIFIKM